MFDYKLIQALAMVVREGGFERAARLLNITQSAVSQRIKLLEEQMGRILLSRSSPPRATPHGRKLLKHYQQVERLENDLHTEIDTAGSGRFTTLAVGINADTLATWFLKAVHPFLEEEQVLLDIRTDDQEQTLRLLKDGEVVGCLSTQERPIQGCRIDFIGRMDYHLYATPEFHCRWFPNGLTPADSRRAPAIIFNRKDELHGKLLRKALGEAPEPIPTSYVPSSEKFADAILLGLGYGMLPLQQSLPFVTTGELVDLAPEYQIPVELYWHCWNIKSRLLEKFTRRLVSEGRALLAY